MKPRPPRNARAWAVWASALLLSTSCTRLPESLASFGSETLTLADLHAYLLTLPEAERRVPAGRYASEWMDGKIRRLALEEVLASTAEAKRIRAEPETAARQLWLHSGALMTALSREIVSDTAPSETELAAKVEDLERMRSSEPILNFQHIYFRLDLAKTPQERAQVRAQAESVAADAQAGGDFSALARRHSESSSAANGGLVMNARPSDLDPVSGKVLATLAEDEVSALVETRTGLHIFRLVRRLEPKPAVDSQLAAKARSLLVQEAAAAAHDALIEDLRTRIQVQTETPPWRIGSWTLDPESLEVLLPESAGEAQRDHLIERFLLAEEARIRGLETPELTEQVVRRSHLELLERLFNLRRRAFDDEITEERLRAFYAAQPSLFNEPETIHLELIFIPQGSDSFSAKKRAEGHVAELRAGSSFAELARRVSTGPLADGGGDLGLLEPSSVSRLGPAVAAAVPELAVGEVSDPIYCTGRILSQDPWLLRGGFAILRLKERIAERTRDFEQAIEDVRRAYSSDHRAELDEELQTKILDEAGFEILHLPDASELVL